MASSNWLRRVIEHIERRFGSRLEAQAEEDGLTRWRERILLSILAASTALCILALAPALYLAFREGLWVLAVFDILAATLCTSLLFLRNLPFRRRAGLTLLLPFLVGITVISQAGFLSGGPAWLFAFSVLAGVLLGIRAALIAIGMNTAAILALAWLSMQGLLAAPPEEIGPVLAVSAGANFVFLNFVAAISVAVLVNGLQAMNLRTLAATQALKDERADLLRTREKLREEIAVRRASEQALRESEQKYRLLAENVRDVIWMTDLELRYTFVSPSIQVLQGFTPEEHHGLKIEQLLTPDSLARARRELARQLELGRQSGSYERSVTLEVDLLHKDGRIIPAEVSASFLLGEGGTPIGILGVTRDITERRRAEEEKRELMERLARSKKMEALGTMAGGVAHDLNNVLSGIISYPDLLLMDLPPDSPLRRPLEVIRESGKKAAAIVQDLLTLARRGVPTFEVVNLNLLVEEYLVSPEYLRLKAFHPRVEVETRLSDDLLNILGSPINLSKTIMNLVSNAAEAMPDGGKVVIATENVHFDAPPPDRALREGDYAVLRVTDTGIGIPPEDLQRIFEPFFTKKKMGRSGTGLGMAVVWGTVEDHRGAIDVQSTEGRGTVITVFLPATRESCPLRSAAVPLDALRGSGEKVLVVDDMKEQREIAVNIIGQLGYDVRAVESGEQAVELLRHEKVDLLVLDMIMDPGIDGLETLHRVKQLHPHQKAIITSGYAETERVRIAQQLGAGCYLKKPYTVQNLAAAIKAELSRG